MGARLEPVRLLSLVVRWMGDMTEQAESLGKKQVVGVHKRELAGDCFLAKGRSFLQLVAFL